MAFAGDAPSEQVPAESILRRHMVTTWGRVTVRERRLG